MISWVSWFIFLLFYSVSPFVCCHVLLHKEDSRAALGWVAVVLGIPILGMLLYFMFGLNRISTIAKHWENAGHWALPGSTTPWKEKVPHNKDSLTSLDIILDNITTTPLQYGIQVDALIDGDETYPEMIKAIEGAKSYIYLSTYIFSVHGVGREIADAIGRAKDRGVTVRVLIDGVGGLYSFPTAYRYLKYKKIPVALFLPPFRGWYHTLHLNLRNHRKMLMVDGSYVFTGGTNIHSKYLPSKTRSEPKFHDLHFKFQNGDLRSFEYVFAKDWFFATGESLKPYPAPILNTQPQGAFRILPSSPNEPLDIVFKGILSTARHSIKIMTPYLILDPTFMSFMQLAVLRGVSIELILPEKNNLFFVKAASESLLLPLMQFGVKVFYRPGSFAHSKLMIVDEEMVFLGSGNLDTRSFYLNFELTVQVKQTIFLQSVLHHFQDILGQSRQLVIQDLQSWSIVIKLRNAFFRLFSPYL